MLRNDAAQKIITGIVFSFSLLLISSPSFAQENGKIYQLTYLPSEPVVLEDTTLSIGVENQGDKTQSYLMSLQIIEEGKIVHEQEFTFTLERTKGIFFTPKYTPQTIGEHQAIVRLYDKLGFDLFDTQLMKFNVVSHLGPFDIEIEPLTARIRPGLLLPAKVFLENMGAKGTDVEVRLTVDCPDKRLTQSSTFFVPSNAQSERLISMQTCEQEGLYDIYADIVLFNKTWVSSSSQFYVNSTYIQLQFDVPEKLTLKPGENYTLPIEVTNLGNQKIHDLQFVVQRIPLAWQKTTPSSITEVEPNETVVFILSISIPKDAEPRSYESRMTVFAEEVLERKILTLEIVSLAVLPIALPVQAVHVFSYLIISLLVSATTLITAGLVYTRKKKRELASAVSKRSDIIKKIKDKIKS